jgi:hypothetical protein
LVFFVFFVRLSSCRRGVVSFAAEGGRAEGAVDKWLPSLTH